MKASNASPELKTRIRNQLRVKEEAGMVIDRALELEGLRRTDLARLLGTSRSYVTKILDQHNFTLETLADVGLALGYAVHFYFTRDPARMHAPQIEREEPLSMTKTDGVTYVVHGGARRGSQVVAARGASATPSAGAA